MLRKFTPLIEEILETKTIEGINYSFVKFEGYEAGFNHWV
jgi:hypothetical protein